MSTRNISWGGKGGQCVRLTALPSSCADCFEILEPQNPGTLRVCPGLYRDYFTFTTQKADVCLPVNFSPVRDSSCFSRRRNTLWQILHVIELGILKTHVCLSPYFFLNLWLKLMQLDIDILENFGQIFLQ